MAFGVPDLVAKTAARSRGALTPEEEEGIVRSLGRKALTGLSFVGNVLDTPGGVVRDVLSGKNPLPGVFSPEQRTTGRQLLENVGLAGKNQEGKLDPGDVGGLATEILLDPTTYLTLGASALGKGGQIAKAAGILGKPTRVGRMTTTLNDLLKTTGPEGAKAAERAATGLGTHVAEHLDRPLGGLVGIGLPFAKPVATVGHGPTAQKIAALLDTAGAAAKASLPGRVTRSLFSAPVQGALTEAGQEGLTKISEAEAKTTAAAKALSGQAEELAQRHGVDRERIREIFEDPASIATADESELYDLIKPALNDLRQAKLGANVPVGFLEDELSHFFPRKMSIAPNIEQAISARTKLSPMQIATQHGSQQQRLEQLKGIKGSTKQIREMAMDPRVDALIEKANADSSIKARDIGKQIAELYPDVFHNKAFYEKALEKATLRAQATGKAFKAPTLTPAEYHATQFFNTLRDIFPEVRKAGIFGNDALADLEQHMTQGGAAVQRSLGVMDMLAKPGVLRASGDRHVAGTAKLHEVLRTLGIRTGDELEGAVRDILEKKGTLATGLPPEALAKQIKAAKNLRIDAKLAKDLTRPFENAQLPEALQKVIGGYDTLTNLTKAHLTGVWPAFHTRNFVSGQVQNLLNGTFDFRDLGHAWKMLTGKHIAGISKVPVIAEELARRGLAGDQAGTDIFRQMVRSHGLVGKYQGEYANTIGRGTADTMLKQKTAADLAQEYAGGLGGSLPLTAGKIGRKAVGIEPGTTLKPWDIRGVAGRQESRFGPAAAGEDLGFAVETLNRAAPFLNLLKKGVDPAEAAKLVNAAQVGYAAKNFTTFEREVLQRLIPFYKFAKGQAGYVAKELAEKPGGRMAQTIRASNAGHDPDEMVPEQVSGSMGIRIPENLPLVGGGPGSAPRYLTSLGLMHEDPLQLAANPIPGSGGPRQAGLEALSRLNPLLKGALEAATGHSLFQRTGAGPRPLDDLDPILGRLVSNIAGKEEPALIPGERVIDPLLANSPASRLLTAARTATDPRKNLATKLLNLGTGARITDVPERTQDALLRDQMQAQLRDLPGSRQFLDVYVPKDVLARMSPADQDKALRARAVLSQLDRRARERSKERLKAQQHIGAGSL